MVSHHLFENREMHNFVINGHDSADQILKKITTQLDSGLMLAVVSATHLQA